MAFPKLVVIGFTNIDVNVTPSKETIAPGGAGFFVAIAASLFLPNVGLVTRVGNDFDPSFLLSRVSPDGVKLIRDKVTARSTQTYASDSDLTQRNIKLEDGVAADLNSADIPEGWIEHAEFIHIATMPPAQQAAFQKYVMQYKLPQAIVSIDTDQYFFNQPELIPIIEDNFACADLIFTNRFEYQTLERVVKAHAFAVVKQDEGGAYILKKGKKVLSGPAPRVTAIDVTGAGDVFAGTFLAKQALGDNLEASLKQAITGASHSVTAEGVMHLFE